MSILWAMTVLTALCVVVFAVRVAIFLRRCPVLLLEGAMSIDLPLISVVLPVRNEAVHIERCVRALLGQTYPRFEVVVVDDGSTDATPEILRALVGDGRLKVIQGAPLPRGWTGKNHALHVGVQEARGDWLLFIDADVLVQCDAVLAAYQCVRRYNAAMLSLWVRQELVSFWERVAQPVIVGMSHATDPFQHVSDSRYPDAAFANGQFILVERAVYERIGGHAAVREAVVEDQMLSRLLKYAGGRMVMLDGTGMVSTRMYSSFAGIWEGWSKNNFLILGRRFLVVCGAVLAVYFVAVSPFVLALWALLWFLVTREGLGVFLVNFGAVGLVLGTRWRARSYVATPLWDFLWHPIGGLVFIAIFINSAYQHTWGRGVTWKGRRYGEVLR